jgi:hypothetical protein
MAYQFPSLLTVAFLLVLQVPANAFSLSVLSDKELKNYALTTSRGCINNTLVDEGAGPEDYCSMAIDYIREIMKRRGWSYKNIYR